MVKIKLRFFLLAVLASISTTGIAQSKSPDHLLNKVYEKMLVEGVAKKILDELARISPLAWHHLFFTGRYSFKNAGKTTIDVAAMAAVLEKHLKQAFWTA